MYGGSGSSSPVITMRLPFVYGFDTTKLEHTRVYWNSQHKPTDLITNILLARDSNHYVLAIRDDVLYLGWSPAVTESFRIKNL